MSFSNPFASDPVKGAVYEQGYELGYAEPNEEAEPPLSSELIETFHEGQNDGRNDRRAEPSSIPPLPASPTRFESAPDGTLIPIPDEAPSGNVIREDAQISVAPRSANGYYVAIFNGPADQLTEDVSHWLAHALAEDLLVTVEHQLARAAIGNLKFAVRIGGGLITVITFLLTPSPLLKEYGFREYLADGTPVIYQILTPDRG